MEPASEPARARCIRLTSPAVADLTRLAAHAPQAFRWALKEMLLLEGAPNAGEPLLGGFMGWQKLIASEHDWRIVWRLTSDPGSGLVIEVAEVWAAGACSDKEVYEELTKRIAAMPDNPYTVSLAEVIDQMGKFRLALMAERLMGSELGAGLVAIAENSGASSSPGTG